MIPAVLSARLRNQGLTGSRWRSPAEVVGALGAVQSQDYAGAKWAVGLRAPTLRDADVDRAFDAGEILRLHILRPTWHFVSAEDITWLLALTAPRVQAACRGQYRREGLTDADFAKSRKVFSRVLGGGATLTRAELAAHLAKAGLAVTGSVLAHVLMQAELEGQIVSGPRRGRQFTYALLDSRSRPSAARSRDESLAELTRRFFSTHGPATRRDFAWWSGLTVADAERGLAMNGDALDSFVAAGRTCWQPRNNGRRAPARASAVLLLPNYDECLVAYRDRPANPDGSAAPAGQRRLEFVHQIVEDGAVIGRWRREMSATGVTVTATLFTAVTPARRRAVSVEVERLGAFLRLPAALKWT